MLPSLPAPLPSLPLPPYTSPAPWSPPPPHVGAQVEDVAIRRDLLEDVGGIILDSAPAPVTEDLAAQWVQTRRTAHPPITTVPSLLRAAHSVHPAERREG